MRIQIQHLSKFLLVCDRPRICEVRFLSTYESEYARPELIASDKYSQFNS